MSQSILDLDLETFSEVPIANGTHRYAEKAEVMLFAWGIDGGPVSVVDEANGEKRPAELREALADPHVLVRAHNSFFDRTVLNYTGTHIALLRWRDTMVQALAHSMPGSLGTLCEILGVDADNAKDKEGKALIQLFCKPRPKSMKLRRATKQTHPEEWARFRDIYAPSDIHAMRAVAAKLPNWNYRGEELALWHLDQQINDRGFAVDMDLVHAAIRGVDRAQKILAARTQELTDGEVKAATQRDAMLRHILGAYGVDLPDMAKITLERRIYDESLPWALRELLAVRLDSSTTSTSKYKTLLKATSADGRLRGTLQFDGASRTGRWAGRMFQPQNLPRSSIPQSAIDLGIEALKADCEDIVAPNVMALTSSCIRGAIVAPEGKKLVVADLSNIEGRMLAWLAGEEWKLQAFRDFDSCKGLDGRWYSGNEMRDAVFAKNPIALELDKKGDPTRRGHDLYALAYAKAFGITAEMVMENKKHGDGSMRQIGKVMELALGYEGGVGAFITFAAVYSIDLEALADQAFDGIPADIMAEARGMLEWTRKKKRSTFGLSDKAFLVCESFKRLWRYAHPNIVAFWKELGDGARKAIQQHGVVVTVRKLKLQRKGAWLKIQLPSGRLLCYPSPAVEPSGQITYMGVNQYSRKWCRLKTYGGKLAENCIAKDTPVLTQRGWVPIQQILAFDRVWDGLEWVCHSGVVYKGNLGVMLAYGVAMTPDHQVLTTEGWKDASQSERYNRAPCRLPDSGAVLRFGRSSVVVGSPMRLRDGKANGGIRAYQAEGEGHSCVVRMHAGGEHSQKANHAWNEQASGFRSLELYAGEVRKAVTSGMEKLRRPRDFGLRALASVRKLLGGYGANLPGGVIAGAEGQFWGLLPQQLRMGDPESTSCKHSKDGYLANPCGADALGSSGRPLRGETLDAGISVGSRLAVTESVRPVFDIVNCGPRNRFVVFGAEGPIIVHNCTQAVSRDVISCNMPKVEAAGYQILLTVHDEDITEAPDTEEFSADHLAALMSTNPEWCPDLPLAAAGFEAYRYKKD